MRASIKFTLASSLLLPTLIISGCGSSGGGDTTTPPADDSTALTTEQVAEQALGRKLFFDADLSSEGNQSCADCHAPVSGFADPDVSNLAPVSEGSVTAAFGNRNAPTSAYAKFIPDFTKVTTTTVGGTASHYRGGQFLDGRAIDLIEQAKGPFLNPVEMNNTDAAEVVSKVELASYSDEFIAVYGATAFDDVETAYTNIATAIAAFEQSTEMSPFSSKFDAVRTTGDITIFSESERRGMQLFMDPVRAKCANCHVITRPPVGATDENSIFSDFNYFNIGVPVNPANPSTDIDIGLAGNVNIDAADITTEEGKFRTPTLRNIAETAPYMHNGVYQTLEDVIRHYDITVATYLDDPGFVSQISPQSVPEVTTNIAEELKVSLGLTPQEYIDLESFMRTLSDGYVQ